MANPFKIMSQTVDAFQQGMEEAKRAKTPERLDLGDCGRYYTRLAHKPIGQERLLLQFWKKRNERRIRLHRSVYIQKFDVLLAMAPMLSDIARPSITPQFDMQLPRMWRLWLRLCGRRAVWSRLVCGDPDDKTEVKSRYEFKSQTIVRLVRTDGWRKPSVIFLTTRVSRSKNRIQISPSTFRLTLEEADILAQQIEAL